jgi:hypothetical protein
MLAAAAARCGGDKGTPTSPTPTSSQTRVIALEGDLSFGDVPIGTSVERSFRIRNTGNATLTITGMTVPSGGGSVFASSFTNGTIGQGGVQNVTLRFSPTENKSYSGALTVNGDQTSGNNTMGINARGQRPLFTRSGVGASVFDMPTDVSRIQVNGSYNGNCENFVVSVGGRLVVNEILGSCSVASGRTYSGQHLVSGGVTEVKLSTNVSWAITEIR